MQPFFFRGKLPSLSRVILASLEPDPPGELVFNRWENLRDVCLRDGMSFNGFWVFVNYLRFRSYRCGLITRNLYLIFVPLNYKDLVSTYFWWRLSGFHPSRLRWLVGKSIIFNKDICVQKVHGFQPRHVFSSRGNTRRFLLVFVFLVGTP